MTDLWPTTQAVLDAFLNGYICSPKYNVAFESDRNGLAAALRVVADQVLPVASPRDRASWSPFAVQIRSEILAIAAELEVLDD